MWSWVIPPQNETCRADVWNAVRIQAVGIEIGAVTQLNSQMRFELPGSLERAP